MYDVFAISAYIINSSIDMGNPITNLKLQKLLYYVQAKFLVETGNPCFQAEIQAWKHGPVVPDAYRDFRDYGSEQITDKVTSRIDKIAKLFFDSKEINLDQNQAKTVVYQDLLAKKKHLDIINQVIKNSQDYTAWELVNKTHEELKWVLFYKEKENQVIKNSTIQEYYSMNQEQLL